jgi:single-strand DNA-binding protein
MAGSVNRGILIGNVGRDPEVRTTQAGKKVASLSLATSESWIDRQSGERKERAEWHRVVVFNDKTAEFVEKYVRKGAKLYVEGSLHTRKWTDQQGADRYSTEVEIGAFKGDIQLLSDGGGSQRASERREAGGGDLDDEIPFGPCWQ